MLPQIPILYHAPSKKKKEKKKNGLGFPQSKNSVSSCCPSLARRRRPGPKRLSRVCGISARPGCSLQTGFTMINGAVETADNAPEPASLPSGASQALEVGGGLLPDQNNPSPARGRRCPRGISSLTPPGRARPTVARPPSQGPGK